jgi:hypothetical protein
MCQCKLYHFHNQKVCVNKNITCSSPRGMFPLGIETIWKHTFSIPFHILLIWIQFIKPLTSKIIFATWRKKLHFFPHLHPNLLAPFFVHLPFICNCYTSFCNCKSNFTRMVTPNILESMIEYVIISNTLYRICKMTTKPLEYPRDPTLLEPLNDLLEIRTRGR